MSIHPHRAVDHKRITLSYCGHSVRPSEPNPSAHGGVTHYDFCACGAKRMTNSAGRGRVERGEWEMPAPDPADVRYVVRDANGEYLRGDGGRTPARDEAYRFLSSAEASEASTRTTDRVFSRFDD